MRPVPRGGGHSERRFFASASTSGLSSLCFSRFAACAYSSTVLAQVRVNTVFENGLGSSFYQHAAEVHDDEGARDYRTFPIQYDPDAQRVDLDRKSVV